MTWRNILLTWIVAFPFIYKILPTICTLTIHRNIFFEKKFSSKILLSLYLSPVVCAIISTHLSHMHSSTLKTSQGKVSSCMINNRHPQANASTRSTEKYFFFCLFLNFLNRDQLGESKGVSLPCATTCEQQTPFQDCTNSSLDQLEEVKESPNTVEPPTPYNSPAVNRLPTSHVNHTGNSAGIIEASLFIHPLNTKHMNVFNSWYESYGNESSKVLFLRLSDIDYWVAVPDEDMMMNSFPFHCYEKVLGDPIKYRPYGFPEFTAYTGVIIPNNLVTGIKHGKPEPDWFVYKAARKLQREIFQTKMAEYKKKLLDDNRGLFDYFLGTK